MNLQNKDIEGNQLIYIDHDGNILCCDCMQIEIDQDRQNPDAVCGSVHWEGPVYNCSGCKVELAPVYE